MRQLGFSEPLPQESKFEGGLHRNLPSHKQQPPVQQDKRQDLQHFRVLDVWLCFSTGHFAISRMALMLRAKVAANVAAHSTARAFSTNVFANYSVFDGDIVMNIRPAFPRLTQRSYGWTMNRRVRLAPTRRNSCETRRTLSADLQGGIAFEFSQRKPDGGGFDWDNRATFVLDLPEVGEFAVDQADPVSTSLSFAHRLASRSRNAVEIRAQCDPF